MADLLLRPDLSGLEQTLDPIAVRNQADFRGEVSRAEADVSSKKSFAGLPEADKSVIVEKLARARFARQRQAESDMQADVRPISAMPVQGTVAEMRREGSLLDYAGLGGLRNPESIGDVLPVVGALAGPQVLRRTLPPAANRYTSDVLSKARDMLVGTEKARDLTGGIVGASAGAIMENQIEQASAAVRAGLTPEALPGAPTLGFFLTGPVDTTGRPVPVSDKFSMMANAALREGLLEAAGYGVGDILAMSARKGFSLLVGDEKLAARALADAERVGVPVGLVDVVDPKTAPIPSTLRKVFGAAGPLGSTFRKQAYAMQETVRNRATGLVRGISPEIGRLAEMAARGEDVNRITRVLSERVLGKFSRVSRRYAERRDQLFGALNSSIGPLPAVPATTTSEAAQMLARYNLANGRTARFVRRNAVDQIEGLNPAELELLADDVYEKVDVDAALPTLREIADLAARLEPEPSISALLDFSKQVESELVKTDSKFVASQLMQVRRAIEADIRIALRGRPELLAQMDEANGFVESFLALMGGSAGRRVRGTAKDFGSQRIQLTSTPGGRVVKNAGPKDHTLLLETLSGADSPGEVRQLHGLLQTIGDDGRRVFRQVAATRLQRTVTAALAEEGFNVRKAFGALGLFDPASKRGRVTREFLQLAGADIEMINTFSRVAKRALPERLNLETATMMARRVVLGGIASGVLGTFGLTRAMGTGEGLAAASATAVATYLMANKAGELLTNPALTRSFIHLADPQSSPLLRQTAFSRLYAAGLLAFEQNVEHSTGRQGQLSVATPLPLERGEGIPAQPPARPGVR